MLSATGICSLAFAIVLILAGHDTALQLPFAQIILLENSCALKENHHLQISPLSESISECYCLR